MRKATRLCRSNNFLPRRLTSHLRTVWLEGVHLITDAPARLFGLRHYAAIYGLLSAFFYCGIALGGISYGVIRTATGSYDPAIAGSALALGIAVVLFLLLGRRPAFDPAAPSTSNQPLPEAI